MNRYAIGLQYLGTAYHGWQKQAGLSTIQEQVERAITQVADHPVAVFCAGRTDKGVHARQQIIHFDTIAFRSHYAWLKAINHYLPHDIRVQWIQPVPLDFHARFSARARRYHYWIDNRSIASAFFSHQLTWVSQPLVLSRMQEAATYLLGEHDFSSFRGKDCQAEHPIRTLQFLNIQSIGSHFLLDIQANAFLQHMVRNIVGVLLKVGMGYSDPDWVKTVLEKKDRRVAAKTAPPYGLYLVGVDYPEDYGLPLRNYQADWADFIY